MIFKDYGYSSESYALDIRSSALEAEREDSSNLGNSKGINTNTKNKTRVNKKKHKGLAGFLVKNNVMLMIGLVFILGFTIISRDGKVYALQKELSSINKDISNVVSENDALQVKLLKAVSLDDISSTAKERLNMVFPSKEDVINLEN